MPVCSAYARDAGSRYRRIRASTAATTERPAGWPRRTDVGSALGARCSGSSPFSRSSLRPGAAVGAGPSRGRRRRARRGATGSGRRSANSAAIQKLAGKPEETLAPPKPVVLGEATSGSLPPCSGMNTPARELGAARASRVVKCLVDGIRPKPLRTSGKLTKAASRHASRMVQAQFFSHEDPANKSHVAERVRRTGYLQGVQGWESGRTSRGGPQLRALRRGSSGPG
jgi:hypothetical protein